MLVKILQSSAWEARSDYPYRRKQLASLKRSVISIKLINFMDTKVAIPLDLVCHVISAQLLHVVWCARMS